jgi:hypothetical protein
MLPYVQNVASDFIFLILSALIGLVIHHFSGRRRLLKFFDIERSKNLCLYLSNLSIPVGGSLGVDSVPRSYSGPAIPLYEVHILPIFQRLFNLLIPGLDSVPGFLKTLVLSDVILNVLASPLNQSDVDQESTLITIGSPGYNRASERVERHFHALAKFVNNNSDLQLGNTPPITDCAFVQRAVDQTTGQVGFYVAGPSARGTTGAAFYLVKHWKQLARRYPGQKPFCVMLRIGSQDARQCEVLFER